MRYRYTLHLAGILLGATFGHVTSALSLVPPPPPPVILTVAVDPTENVLILTGNHFGKTLPTVYLRGEALPVKSFSPNEVVANLPSALPPAFYRLTLVNGTDQTKRGDFIVEIAPSTSDFAQAAPE